MPTPCLGVAVGQILGQVGSSLPARALLPGTRGMEECGAALGRWLRLLRRQLVTGIFHPRLGTAP